MSCVAGVSAVWRLECRRGKTALAGEVTALSCRQSAPYAPWFLILHSGVETFILDGTKFAHGLAGSDATGRRRIPVKVHVLETSTLDLPRFSDSSFWRIFIEHREYIPSPFSKLTPRHSVTTLHVPYMAIPSCGREHCAMPTQESGLGGRDQPAEPFRALSTHRQDRPVCRIAPVQLCVPEQSEHADPLCWPTTRAPQRVPGGDAVPPSDRVESP